jgi:hypothetical protein
MRPLRAAASVLVLATACAGASAQGTPPPATPMHRPMGGPTMHGPGAQHVMHGPGAQHVLHPVAPGQAAFGAIQEIVGQLEADPATDWSKVDVDALRQHLIDMDEVTMRAVARKEPIDGGMRLTITGSDRTLEAIQRMVPAHASEIDGRNGWTVRTSVLPNGVELTVTTGNSADVPKIRALGFMGVMVQGGHHQPHHLAMAKGDSVQGH